MTLENITKQGKLSEIFPLFDRSTIQHSDEIQRDRLTDKDLRSSFFWTADFPMYVMEGKEAVLYMGRNKDNLIFNNILESTKQLRERENYFINDTKDIASVIDSDTTLRFALSDLKLKGDHPEWQYFEINITKYDNLNSAQRMFAERVHGKGQAFIESMNILNEACKGTHIHIYVLNPEYVRATVPQNGAIARGSFLNNLKTAYAFYAEDRIVGLSNRRLRGVSRDRSISIDDMFKNLSKYVPEINHDKFKTDLERYMRG